MSQNQTLESPETPAEEKDLVGIVSHDLFSEFKSMLKTAYAQKWDTETRFPWVIEIPMTHEQVAIWDKVMNPKENDPVHPVGREGQPDTPPAI